MWRELVVESLTDPRAAARRVLSLGLPMPALIEAAIAVTALGVVAGYIATQLSPGGVDQMSNIVLGVPLVGAAIQFGLLLLVAGLTFRVGQAFGGTGNLEGALSLVVWLNTMMLVFQAAQITFLVILPPLAAILSLVSVIWIFWAFTNFVTELHRFESPLKVAGGVFLTMLALFFVVAVFLTLLGFGPEEV